MVLSSRELGHIIIYTLIILWTFGMMFVYLFGVIGPIYWSTNDPVLA